MTNMAAMPIYGKNLKKSSPEPIYRWPWNFVCSIVNASTTKIVQIITLGWPWHILRQGQIWWHRLLYGKNWKLFIFGHCCSLKSQRRLKHSTQWVNEVEWVSKVKFILWSWSTVTQISKLNVWLLACILKWAIQGLLALLFAVAVVCSILERTSRLEICISYGIFRRSLPAGDSVWKDNKGQLWKKSRRSLCPCCCPRPGYLPVKSNCSSFYWFIDNGQRLSILAFGWVINTHIELRWLFS